ncbi:MAG: ABC transporter permease [Salinibacterium sp.]|nr:ABC transporter permease [Salinibacterium sp.]
MTSLTAARSRRWGAWYVTEHRLRAMRTYVGTIVATALGTPILYLFAFGVGLATLVTGNVGPGGSSYLQFVAPALLATAAVTVGTEEYLFGILMGFKWNPIFIGMNSTPLTARQIIDGTAIFIIIRMAIVVVVYYLVMLAFGAVPSPWGLAMIPIGILTGLAFSPLAAFSSTIYEDKGQFAVLQRVVILPLTLFSGTVFPLAQLPIYLQWVGWLSPLWHGSELGRQASYGPTEPTWLTVVHVAYLLLFAFVGWALTVRIARKRLNK